MRMKPDPELQHDVREELEWEPAIDATHVGVSARQGLITLVGYVASFSEKYLSQLAAARVYGVRGVVNELDVKLRADDRRTDADIATACQRALQASYAVPEARIGVRVHDGRVRLDGDVEWQYQKAASEHAVRDLTGVTSVINHIEIKPRASPIDVKQKIEAALRRSAEVEARRIDVEIHGGMVILHGHVRSWTERDEADRAAWAAPGVTSVETGLVVEL
jgi:osmotically-inducible protein OsmY